MYVRHTKVRVAHDKRHMSSPALVLLPSPLTQIFALPHQMLLPFPLSPDIGPCKGVRHACKLAAMVAGWLRGHQAGLDLQQPCVYLTFWSSRCRSRRRSSSRHISWQEVGPGCRWAPRGLRCGRCDEAGC